MKSNNLAKILLSTFIVIFAGVTFLSCNDDDDKNKKQESGTWIAYVQDCRSNVDDTIAVVQLEFKGDSLFTSVMIQEQAPCSMLEFDIDEPVGYKYKVINDTIICL